MSPEHSNRTISGSDAAWRAGRRGKRTTTARWQDKSAHIARRSGGWFCWVFWLVLHIAALRCNVRRRPNPLYLRCLSHIATCCHGR